MTTNLNTGKTTAVYTAIATLIVISISTLSSYVYSSSNNIVALQKEVAHISEGMKKVTLLLEGRQNNKENILLLKQEMLYLQQRVEPFMAHGSRFSLADFKRGKQDILLYVDNQIKQNKDYCITMVKESFKK